jgi:Fe-S-cluster containining protein
MQLDFEPFFRPYEQLVVTADKAFAKIEKEFPDAVKCKIHCTECCHALFDLSLVEAIYIHHRFNEMLPDDRKSPILEKANKSDRLIYKIKRKAFKDFESGRSEADILSEMAMERVACPLLNDMGQCELYAFRPITCRLYGIPVDIGGVGRTCGKSGFKKGMSYPTVHLDMIHNKLHEISRQLATSIQSKYSGLSEMLVPLSMALLTDYDETYLGTTDDSYPSDSENNEGR